MSQIFGANWKTTVTAIGGVIFGALTWLSSVSYDTSPLALVIPAKYKVHVQYVAGSASVILWIWNGILQKSKNVTGGTTQQTADGAVADPSYLGGVSKSVADTEKAKPKE